MAALVQPQVTDNLKKNSLSIYSDNKTRINQKNNYQFINIFYDNHCKVK